jgi:putative hemolysin
MEDLVEELVGDIKDEYDVDEAETTRHRGGDIEVDGLLNLDDFEDETGIELPEGPYETVAGYIMARLGRLPKEGDSVDFDGHRIVVRDVENRRVGRVLVTVVPPPVVVDPSLGPVPTEIGADEAGPTHEGERADRRTDDQAS